MINVQHEHIQPRPAVKKVEYAINIAAACILWLTQSSNVQSINKLSTFDMLLLVISPYCGSLKITCPSIKFNITVAARLDLSFSKLILQCEGELREGVNSCIPTQSIQLIKSINPRFDQMYCRCSCYPGIPTMDHRFVNRHCSPWFWFSRYVDGIWVMGGDSMRCVFALRFVKPAHLRTRWMWNKNKK